MESASVHAQHKWTWICDCERHADCSSQQLWSPAGPLPDCHWSINHHHLITHGALGANAFQQFPTHQVYYQIIYDVHVLPDDKSFTRSGFSGRLSNIGWLTDVMSTDQQAHAQSSTNLSLWTEPSDGQLHKTHLHEYAWVNVGQLTDLTSFSGCKIHRVRGGKKLNYQKSTRWTWKQKRQTLCD